MVFAIAVTDQDWFEFHRNRDSRNDVNFWTPTPWRIRSVRSGDEWYFLLKSPIRKIGGFGIFQSYRELTVEQSWERFGLGNGVTKRDELTDKTRLYSERNSIYPVSGLASVIGSIHLDDCQFFDDEDFVDLQGAEISFGTENARFKANFPVRTFPLPTPDRNPEFPRESNEFRPVTSDRSEYQSQRRRRRVGQQSFRRAIINAYEGRCAFTGENVDHALEASHIEPYINANSNHIQNGILLRADLHRLFDYGLISVDSGNLIMTSSVVSDSRYKELSGKRMRLPTNPLFHPSTEALRVHRTTIFKSQD